jgi:hypothetical protein
LSEGDERPPKVLAEFTDYDGMLAAVRARVNELQVNGERFDEFAGLPRGYLSKLIGIRPSRGLGKLSLGLVMNGLGMSLLAIENQEATARLKNRLLPRNQSYVRSAPSIVLTVRFFQKIGRKGARARINNSTAEQRRKWARRAAIARWRGS